MLYSMQLYLSSRIKDYVCSEPFVSFKQLEDFLMTRKPEYEELQQRVKELESEAIRRQKAEEALRKSEVRYRAVVQDQTELICRFTPDGTLTFVNDSYCRYLARRLRNSSDTSLCHSFRKRIISR